MAGASRPWGGRRTGGSRRGGATARGKIEGSEGELAHHHGNGLETTWSMGSDGGGDRGGGRASGGGGPPVQRRVWWARRRMWERGRVKGQPQGSLGRLYRARRGGKGRRSEREWLLMAMASGLDCFKGEHLMAEGN
jgi:hypothetical protein